MTTACLRLTQSLEPGGKAGYVVLNELQAKGSYLYQLDMLLINLVNYKLLTTCFISSLKTTVCIPTLPSTPKHLLYVIISIYLFYKTRLYHDTHLPIWKVLVFLI